MELKQDMCKKFNNERDYNQTVKNQRDNLESRRKRERKIKGKTSNLSLPSSP